MNAGDIERANDEAEAACAEFRVVGDRWGLIASLVGVAEMSLARGRAAEAIRASEEAYGYAAGGHQPGPGRRRC